ncbi:acyl-CoA thioester hydrolase/BAAT C-terminal domain-containing protein [uncultured Serinicoccus sp.]|uniref:acyl-CoA thioester hydrolase/BAAT C-terminal domain-containing protein n=1 Tax=uncultured Serinicoccus sp. TaxID=735514 RepID=UPI00260297A7|nr:acyl-CoA thioester hydrolase/BAAT C-terminal domain-containing protein [uncultured Serinicoccus sp.]
MEVFRPARPTGTGVLVLAGSSGRVDTQRAKLLANHGALALPMQWFGGPDQPPGPWQVPVETFTSALDLLAEEADFLAIVGVSFGAEAALVTASLDPRVGAVAAFAPSHVTWPAYDPAQQQWVSHWSWQGRPLPFVPIPGPSTRTPDHGPPSYLPLYRASIEAATAETLAQATIRVEDIPDVLVVSGGDDQVWPSADFARAITSRRTSHRLDTCHVHLPEAGHRTILPGEDAPVGGRRMARGGTPDADRTLGAMAWPHLLTTLRLPSHAA